MGTTFEKIRCMSMMMRVFCLEIGPEGYIGRPDDLRRYLRDTLIVTGDIWEPIFFRAVSDYQCLFDRVVVCLSDIAVGTAVIRGKTVNDTVQRVHDSPVEYADCVVTDEYVVGLWGTRGKRLADKYKIDYITPHITRKLTRCI